MTSFADLGVPAPLCEALARQGITDPFPVQAATIPDALAGKDVCGRAPTGSGKTLAYGLPLLARIGWGSEGKPRALILVPTRELAQQVLTDLVPLAKAQRRWVAGAWGGAPYGPQLNSLRKGAEVMVACPGRLLDLIEKGACDLSDVQMVVIDEADRMADLGFMPEVRKLLDMVTAEHTTLLFSATLDGAVDELVRTYQQDPVFHNLTRPEDEAPDLEHLWWEVRTHERPAVVAGLVASADGPTIVFARTRLGAERAGEELTKAGLRVEVLHGGLSQAARSKALDRLKRKQVSALVATDVAARGIHVDGMACVVHWDLPDDPRDHTHRSGRTGRAGARGLVVATVPPHHRRRATQLQRTVGLPPHGLKRVDHARLGDPAAIPEPPPEFDRHPRRDRSRDRRGERRGGYGRSESNHHGGGRQDRGRGAVASSGARRDGRQRAGDRRDERGPSAGRDSGQGRYGAAESRGGRSEQSRSTRSGVVRGRADSASETRWEPADQRPAAFRDFDERQRATRRGRPGAHSGRPGAHSGRPGVPAGRRTRGR